MNKNPGQAPDIETLKRQVHRPKKAVVTAGMPYANGPLHIGHLAGAHIPADVYARFMRMLIGSENVLYVCGTDDHGSTSELSAIKSGKSVREVIDEIHDAQKSTLDSFDISLDTYSGTSSPECYPSHEKNAQDMMRRLYKNKLLNKRVSKQWYDPELKRFLQDRFVRGKCPNPKCENESAYSDECDVCGSKYDPTELQHPHSALSSATPELRDTAHLWLDMWSVSEVLREWVQSKKGKWRIPVYNEVINTVLPALSFDNTHEPKYKEIKAALPKHIGKYAPGKKIACQFESKPDLAIGKKQLEDAGIPSTMVDSWAHRSLTRDVSWGIPVPPELDPDLIGKTLYVWPDSLIAPIAFTQVALKQKGRSPDEYKKFWTDPEAQVFQFLGQDNVFFYSVMQGAMWVGSQADNTRQPIAGELQMTDIFGCFHLQVDGQKMSKSLGNFHSGDFLIKEKGYNKDQIRYYLALLGLPEKASNFEFAALEERNKFLAGPLNAAFEKPISACNSKFGGKIPAGTLMEKVVGETTKIVQRYLKAMPRAEYGQLLFAIENYARQINSLFTQFKPHDDRHPEAERADALFTCFYVLKNIMIMLYPFVPSTMDRLRESLRLGPEVFTIDHLGTAMPAGHVIGVKAEYFPPCE
jgi:methionyl-tRNA synthetase